MIEDPLDVLESVEEIPAPLGTGPHEVRELDSWLPWSVYECRRCHHRAWFHARGYERFACAGEPEGAEGAAADDESALGPTHVSSLLYRR